jgi:2-methylisocitrate lyase-like PEP mutase family enzyme
VAALAKLGVARVSLGSSVAEAAYAVARRAAEEAFTAGTYGALADALDYGTLNELMRG